MHFTFIRSAKNPIKLYLWDSNVPKISQIQTLSKLSGLINLELSINNIMSSESLALVEQKIVDMLAQLADAVDQNDQQIIFSTISKIKLLLADRNRKCMILK